MEIDIAARHFQATESLKEYIGEKIGKLDKYALKLELAHVVLEVQKFHHLCEITLSGKNLRMTAKNEASDMYAAFDNCFNNIQLQLRRQHDRVKDHKKKKVTGSYKRLREVT